MRKLYTLFTLLLTSLSILAGTTITYTASEQLGEVTSTSESGLHTNVFNVSISSHTFSNGTGTITFNGELTSIGGYAFYGCSSLTSVTLGNAITSIGSNAFLGCTGLTRVNYTGDIAQWCAISFTTNTSNPLSYAHHLYIDNAEITNLIVPETVTSINWYAFINCSSLTTVSLPNSVLSIGMGAFSGCLGLTSVTLGNAITSIGTQAFRFCSCLTSITIPNSVRSIGQEAFCFCTSLTSVSIGSSVTSIGNEAFRNCSNLTSITIPEAVTSIKSYTFAGCSNLASVTLGNSVTDIQNGAFNLCSNLNSIPLPNSVTSIGDSAFYYCSSLTSISIPNVRNIGMSAFQGCSSLTSVTIPEAITTIRDYTFAGCSSLISIIIPHSVWTIGERTFSGCTNLTSVTWTPVNFHTITSYSSSPFYDIRTNVTSFTLGDSVQSIPAYICYGMTGLTSMTIPESVTSIGSQAFYGCTSLTSVTWNPVRIQSITSISSSPFYGAEITSLSFGDSVQTIPAYVCYGKTSLTSVAIPNSVTSIGEAAFCDCSGLTSVTIGTSVTTIGNHAFARCSNRAFNRLVLPQVRTIGRNAFEDCSYLTSVVFGDKLESVGANAFKDCIRINDMTCYATITPEATSTTFSGVSALAYLNVQAGSARTYRLDPYWGVFDIRELGSDSTVVGGNQVTVTTSDNEATFTWPTADNANAYSLVISKDGVVFCTLTFNANGQLQGIAFAPSRDGTNHSPTATTSFAGMTFTVSGMDIATKYSYRLAVTNAANSEIVVYRGEFATTGYTGTIDAGGLPEGNKYEIIFANDLGEILQQDSVEYGHMPIYLGTAPTKPSTAQYTYIFKGWSPDIQSVVGAATYTAQFDSIVNKYQITFIDEQGVVLQQDSVEYGQMPAYNGATPTKQATAQYTYSFSGWTPALAQVTAATTYTAAFNSTVNEYTITFVNEDGTVLQTDNVAYGAMPSYIGATPTKPSTEENSYVFTGWTPALAQVTCAATYTATFASIARQCTLTLSVNNEDWGIVSGAGTYDYKTMVTCEATPVSGYEFVKWSDGSTYNPYTFILKQDTVLQAIFQAVQSAVNDVEAAPSAEKFFRDGILYIRRGERLYDVTGRLVE